MSGGSMLGLNIPSYPDGHNPLTSTSVVAPGEQFKVLQSVFGPAQLSEINPQAMERINSMTLQRAYEPYSSYMADVMISNFTSGDIDSWYIKLAPFKRLDALSVRWRTYIAQPTTLDPAPERTAPNYVSYTVENNVVSQVRWSLGTETTDDFYKRPEGVKELQFKLRIITQAAWVTAKLLIMHAILDNKMYHQETQAKLGLQCGNLREVFENELNLFAALNKDWTAVTKIANYVGQISKYSPGFVPDMYVLPEGSDGFLALANDKMTNAHIVGENLALSTLSQGGKVVRGLVNGVNIYIDHVYRNLENIGPDDFELLSRMVIIGEYVMSSSTSQPKERHFNEKSSRNHMGFRFIDLSIDNYKEMDIIDLISNCGRWKSDGSLHDDHQVLLNDLQRELDISGVGIADNTLDPYFWNGESPDLNMDSDFNTFSSRNLSGWHIIENWGDMDTRYWSLDQCVEVGTDIAAYIKTKLTAEDERNFAELLRVMDRLNDISEINETINAYFYAVALHRPNRALTFSNLLGKNVFGSVDPPTIVNVGGAKVIRIDGSELYIVVGNDGSFATVDRLSSEYDDILTGTSQKAPAIPSRQGGGGKGEEVTPAPLGQPEVTNVNVANSSSTFAKSSAPLQQDVSYRFATWNDGPAIPYGYGNKSGVETLAQLYKQGTLRGWDVDVLKACYDGLNAWKTIYSYIKELLPKCDLMNANYVPYYMYTGDQETDEENAFFSNLVDHVKSPVWVNVAVDKVQNNIVTVDNDSKWIELRNKMVGGQNVVDFRTFVDKHLFHDSILAYLQTSTQYNKLVQTFNSSSLLGESLYPKLAVDDRWDKFLEEYVLVDNNKDQEKYNVLAGVLGLIVTIITNPKKVTSKVTKQVLEGMSKLEFKPNKKAEKFVGQDGTKNTVFNTRQDASNYVNSRLTLSNKLWKKLAQDAENGSVPSTIIAPNHPLKHGYPLIGTNAQEFSLFKYAKSGFNGTSDNQHENTIFGPSNRHLSFAAASSNSSKSKRGNDDDNGFASSSSHSRSSAFSFANPLQSNSNNASDFNSGKRKRDRENLLDRARTFDLGIDMESDPRETFGSEELLSGASSPFYFRDQNKFEEKPFLKIRFDHVAKRLNTSPLARACGLGFLLSSVHRDSLIALARYGISGLPDSNYILARPFIRLMMDAMIIAKGGEQTAALIYNYEDAKRQLNAENKVWMFHYTIWMNCAIFNARNIMVLQNVRAKQYVGGMDSTLYTGREDFNPKRLTDNKRSGFVFSCGAQFNRDVARRTADPLSLVGYVGRNMIPYELSPHVAESVDIRNHPQWPSFHYYNTKYEFSQINKHKDVPDASIYSALRRNTPFDGLMFSGRIQIWDSVKQQYTERTEGQGTGHLAAFNAPGMRSALSSTIQFRNNRYGGNESV